MAWFPGCSSCAGVNWFSPHLMRAWHECTLDYYHQITLRLFFPWNSFPIGLQRLSALLFEFRVAICFLFLFFLSFPFWQFVSFCTHHVFALLSAFVLSSGYSFHLHYWEGIRLFTTILHLLRCMCGHLFFAYATKRRGLAVSYFPFALILIVGTVLIFFYICF